MKIKEQSYATSCSKFKELGKVPLNVIPEQFDDWPGNKETLQRNKAKWHKTCRNLYCDFKLDRQKRALEPNSDNSGITPVT